MTSGQTGQRSAERHLEETRRNRQAWATRPALRQAYRTFHEAIRDMLTPTTGSLTVELGSGIGAIKTVIPECITTEIFAAPWLERQENAYGLSFPDGAVGNLILFDVWHHLEYPGAALREFARVLRPDGRVILCEPAMSVLGMLVYGAFHPEPLGWRVPLQWEPPAGFSPGDGRYFAAQSLATRIFLRKENVEWTSQWEILSVREIVSFAYLLSGGFRGPCLLPPGLIGMVAKLDRRLSRAPGLLGARVLIVLGRISGNA